MKKYFIIPVEMIDADVTVAINMSEREIVSRYKKQKDSGIEAGVKGWDAGGDPGSVLRLKCGPLILLRQKKNIPDIQTVVHEVAHAAYNVLAERDIHLNHTTEEIFCYLQGFLAKEIMKRIGA